MDNYSLSDLAAVTGGGNAWGGGMWWIIILLVFMFNGGAWGNRGDYGQYATAASQQEILFNQHFNNLDNKMDRGFTSIGNGISDATYALNNTIINESRRTQDAVGQNRYDMANFAAQINSNIDNKFAAMQLDNEKRYSRSLEGRINQLELRDAMCGVVRYPLATTYTSGANPFCGCNNNACC